MPRIQHTIILETASSTNTYAAEHADMLPRPTLIVAKEQTQGLGQRGNTWDALPGDITASLIVDIPAGPNGTQAVAPEYSFVLNQVASLAVCEALAALGVSAQVKWANDIIVSNRKICGLLISTALKGDALHSAVIGYGLNIAARPQSPAHYAPPAIGLNELVASHVDSAQLAESIAERIIKQLDRLAHSEHDEIHAEYLAKLFWREGYHPFSIHATGERIEARIVGILPSGQLQLELRDGQRRNFLFRELNHCIA
ncbi:MAG: biotin--[acetyl-CoA-carboxylase] ligase [Bacteroidetes bacterium]|nr:MAG: biotin--[acetyl-CoA-carboxylase] ligase [Bacteroidota bacterium]